MAEKPCGLIAVIPPALHQGWAADFAALTKRFRPAALVLKNPDHRTLDAILSAARPLEMAVLTYGDLVTACNAGATGVYFSEAGAPITKARDALGSSAVIGAFCGLSRHEAMEAAEAGADFVAFDAASPAQFEKAQDLSIWWDEVTGVPCALAFGSGRPEPSVLSAARPDFILIEETWKPGESLTFATEFGLQSQV
jgi:thiamine-phosphate pyrophosphorylase